MELALYCPDYGFYEKESDTLGRHGHFQTSVNVGNLFGHLLAVQFALWAEQFKIKSSDFKTDSAMVSLQIVEAGAHDGKLAADVMGWFQSRRPELFAALQYFIIEPSCRRRKWQAVTLSPFGERVVWCDSLDDKRLAGQHSDNFRIIFSNELLDAMPVHRLGWDAKRKMWFEWGVRAEGDAFGWARMELPNEISRSTPYAPNNLTAVLPDGFTIEICPAAETWWRDAATILGRGKLLTLDYGLTHEEFFAPHRASGTLRGYHRHRHTDNVLDSPGEQDITAHVNFSTIQQVGERAGLRTEQFTSQTQFLTGIATQTWRDTRLFGEWTPAMTRQFQTLTHPDHFGRAFKVLVQSK